MSKLGYKTRSTIESNISNEEERKAFLEEEKESFKWEASFRARAAGIGSSKKNQT